MEAIMTAANELRESAPKSLTLPARVIVSLRAGAVLAVANVLCVAILAWAYTHVKGEAKAISVTGSAKKAIRSDLIVWAGKISVNHPDLGKGYEALKLATDKTLAYLKSQRISEDAIKLSAIWTGKHFARDSMGHETEKVSSYDLVETVQVTSGDVEHVAEVARNVTGLIKEGVMVESIAPTYLYTKLADLKIEMLAEATKDATARAQQIAGNSGAKLGGIRDARMGVMQINPIHSNSVSDGGNNDTSSLEKEVTAVVSARFDLR
jgi:hypothetical protein